MLIHWASDSGLFDLSNRLVMVTGSGNRSGELLDGGFGRVLKLMTLEALLGRVIIWFEV